MSIFVLLTGLALPLMELAVLVKVGQAIGLWKLLLLLLGMAALGAALLYWQGWTALRQTQDALLRGEPPVGPMLEGMLLVAAGVLLLAPGLITDAFALLLLVPPLRRAIARQPITATFEHVAFTELGRPCQFPTSIVCAQAPASKVK